MAGVGQGYGLVVFAFSVAELAGLAHHWRPDAAAVGAVEVVVPGGGFPKVVILGPLAFEIDGVGDEHCGANVIRRRAGGEGAFVDDGGDFALGLVAGPPVDVGGGLLFPGFVGKVGALRVGAVVGGDEVEELLAEGVAFLAPEGVGDVQLRQVDGGVRPAAGSQFLVKGVEGGMQALRGQVKAEGVGHLGGGVAGGAGVGHGQGLGHAVGGDEQVAVGVFAEGSVEVEGEVVVAGGQGGQFPGRGVGVGDAGRGWSVIPRRRGQG